MWTHADLPDDELERMRHGPCECVSPRLSGTKNGYACSPCRAADELLRREEQK